MPLSNGRQIAAGRLPFVAGSPQSPQSALTVDLDLGTNEGTVASFSIISDGHRLVMFMREEFGMVSGLHWDAGYRFIAEKSSRANGIQEGNGLEGRRGVVPSRMNGGSDRHMRGSDRVPPPLGTGTLCLSCYIKLRQA